MAAKIFHPLLALIASATDKKLARYVAFLKEENKILRARSEGGSQIVTEQDQGPVVRRRAGAVVREEGGVDTSRFNYAWSSSSPPPLEFPGRVGATRPLDIRQAESQTASSGASIKP
jgi:hypothetical protein